MFFCLLCNFILTANILSESDKCEINNTVYSLVNSIYDKNEFGKNLKTYCDSLQNKYDVAQRVTRYNVVLYDDAFINALINLQLADNALSCLHRVKAEGLLHLKNCVKAYKILTKVVDKIDEENISYENIKEVLDTWVTKMYEISYKINVIYLHTVQNISNLNAVIR